MKPWIAPSILAADLIDMQDSLTGTRTALGSETGSDWTQTSFGDWLGSFRGPQEGAWFSLRDPMPFFRMLGRLIGRGLGRLRKRLWGTRSRA